MMWIRNKLKVDDDLTYVSSKLILKLFHTELKVDELRVSNLSDEKIESKFPSKNFSSHENRYKGN